jgi:hypothetical protein
MVSASDLLNGPPEAVVERAEWWQEHLTDLRICPLPHYDRAGWLAIRRVLPAGRKPKRE